MRRHADLTMFADEHAQRRPFRNMSHFETAFAEARNRGLDEFTWRENRYHTRRADDPIPQPAPYSAQQEGAKG